MKSSAVMGSRLENWPLWRRWKVYVRPSAEMVGWPTARSGTSRSWPSNLYRPEKMLRKMSTSAGAEMSAGSRSATSWKIGKLSVWSAASGSAGADEVLGLPTRTTSSRPINAIATPTLPGRYRRTPERGALGGATSSDSEDHLARALALGHRCQRARCLAQRKPNGDVWLDLSRVIKVEQRAGRGWNELW